MIRAGFSTSISPSTSFVIRPDDYGIDRVQAILARGALSDRFAAALGVRRRHDHHAVRWRLVGPEAAFRTLGDLSNGVVALRAPPDGGRRIKSRAMCPAKKTFTA